MYRFAQYKAQYRANLRLAFPIMLAQLGQILTQFADNLMVGRYGGDDAVPLAAVSFGGAVFFLVFITLLGFTMGLTPLVGQLYARSDRHRAAQLLHNGLTFYTLLGLAAAAAQWLATPLLYRLGQPVEVVDAAVPYYRMMVCSMPFLMCFFAFKQFLEGVANTKAAMAATVLSNLANIAFNWIFIYGHWGFREMGAEGAGLATLLARILAAALLAGYFYSRPRYRSYMQGYRPGGLSRRCIGQLSRIGLPIAMQMFLESSAFVGTGIMMGWFSAETMSANQIAITLGNCAFMIVVSVGSAATIRVSHCFGARDAVGLAQAARASFHLVLVWNAFAATLFVAGRHIIPQCFTTNAEVLAIASDLLVCTALFQLSDGLQNVAIGVLRGIQDVKIIMPIAFAAYWLLNLPVGYLLGFTLGLGPSGLFLGYTFGLTSAAVLLHLRIRRRIGEGLFR